MDTNQLVEWQKVDPESGLIFPWFTHPFLDELKTWDLKNVRWLELGSGRSTAWLRSKCHWVDSVDANIEWAAQAEKDCAEAGLNNGIIYAKDLSDGVQEEKQAFFDLLPKSVLYDIISVDSIWRNECLQWALDHFKGVGGVLIADNFMQDYVWVSPAAVELMSLYKNSEKIFYQPDHTNHEGHGWNTRYWIII